jgi:hypothetical protein
MRSSIESIKVTILNVAILAITSRWDILNLNLDFFRVSYAIEVKVKVIMICSIRGNSRPRACCRMGTVLVCGCRMSELISSVCIRVPAHTLAIALRNSGLGNFFDQACHCHLDVELDHVRDRVELSIDHWV